MPDLAFKERHVPAILDGSKPFTMRRAWANGKTPDLRAVLTMVINPRTPQRRLFATGIVQFRTSVAFDCGGFVSFTDWRTTVVHAPVADAVRAALSLANASDSDSRAAGADALARFDGFDSFAAMFAFHQSHRAEGSPQMIRRELIGFGAVTPEFSH